MFDFSPSVSSVERYIERIVLTRERKQETRMRTFVLLRQKKDILIFYFGIMRRRLLSVLTVSEA